MIESQTIQKAGGYMKYWYNAMSTCPSLAQLGSELCSAPGKFVFSIFAQLH